TSGRVSDFAVNPNNPFEYYVAVASGGVWKTVNAGVTYTPLFDSQNSYSIGCITMDPNNTNVLWVGTGENNGQRSVAYGDGVYKSEDGGATWKNMGLKSSEHIGNIVVHPNNSNIVYVAALGPLWNKGGKRGLYKTTNGGKSWKAILTIDEHTGVNEVVMDPKDPNILYASTYQRRRHVYTYVSSGPGSGLHKSTDGGNTWAKIQNGLPTTELGRIGLSISPADPEIIYAIVEAANDKGGFFKSTNRGTSWQKQSDHSTSGNYYQEIIADPVDPNTVYSMDTWMQVTHDGGKTFKNVGEDTKHVDNHCIWINPNNNSHLLVGCDGGIYETFDKGKHWDFKQNLPITQFYKVAVDNAKPFYNVYGGTQDNFSMGGPSRVITDHGITNQDWYMTHGGDGFESQIDPFNPDIIYAQSQYGVLVRYDRKSGEELGIQPKPRKDENAYRWNWDAPLAVSIHEKGRLYFAANKVFRSDDYGNSWQVMSDDLTRQLDRNKLKVFDRVVSIDAVAKNGSTSPYGTIVALSESPVDPNLIAIGTDDGQIQITENGGQSWRKAGDISGAPKQSYINSVYLSQHNADVIYAIINHHKFGDFKPYIFKSKNKGKSWENISTDLPQRGSAYTIEEDHVDPNLIFCGTEFGAFVSMNGGKNWQKLGSGLPTIAVRDMTIHQGEEDLILATFGRGFYIMDDYTSLRKVKSNQTAVIFPIREAIMWEKSTPLGLPGKAFQGDSYYTADNLGPEVIFTYYYKNKFESLKEKRQKREKNLIKEGKNTPYPSYENLVAEGEEIAQELIFTIKNSDGVVIKKVNKKPTKGLQRFNWEMRYSPKEPINLREPSFYNPFAGQKQGTLVAPGIYTVEMSIIKGGVSHRLTDPVSFSIIPLNNTVLPAADRDAKVLFQREISALSAEMQTTRRRMSEINDKIKHIKEAIKLAESPIDNLGLALINLKKKVKKIEILMSGDRIKRKLDIGQSPTPYWRIGGLNYEQKYSTSAPTQTHLDNYAIAKEEFVSIQKKINEIYSVDVVNIELMLVKVGAPYTPGRAVKQKE
ncbi:MAG: glycosyl hydrolase, partial [Saprospiraceae bacterium]